MFGLVSMEEGWVMVGFRHSFQNPRIPRILQHLIGFVVVELSGSVLELISERVLWGLACDWRGQRVGAVQIVIFEIDLVETGSQVVVGVGAGVAVAP